MKTGPAIPPRIFVWENRELIKSLMKDGFNRSEIHKILAAPCSIELFYKKSFLINLEKKPKPYAEEKHANEIDSIGKLWEDMCSYQYISKKLDIPIKSVYQIIHKRIRKGILRKSTRKVLRIDGFGNSDLKYIFKNLNVLTFSEIGKNIGTSSACIASMINRGFRLKSKLAIGMHIDTFNQLFTVNDFLKNAETKEYEVAVTKNGYTYMQKQHFYKRFIPWDKCRRLALRHYGRDHFLYKTCDIMIMFNRWAKR